MSGKQTARLRRYYRRRAAIEALIGALEEYQRGGRAAREAQPKNPRGGDIHWERLRVKRFVIPWPRC
ncbi:MAG: hypothetical protein ABSC23_02015 [Bryobacteraceae bacterium]|jgi:hypothetical protein